MPEGKFTIFAVNAWMDTFHSKFELNLSIHHGDMCF